MTADGDRWQCQGCGTTYVVQSMARHCEAKHKAEQ